MAAAMAPPESLSAPVVFCACTTARVAVAEGGAVVPGVVVVAPGVAVAGGAAVVGGVVAVEPGVVAVVPGAAAGGVAVVDVGGAAVAGGAATAPALPTWALAGTGKVGVVACVPVVEPVAAPADADVARSAAAPSSAQANRRVHRD